MSNSSREKKGERRLIEQCLFRGSRSRARESVSEEIILNRTPQSQGESRGKVGGKSDIEGGNARAKAEAGWE